MPLKLVAENPNIFQKTVFQTYKIKAQELNMTCKMLIKYFFFFFTKFAFSCNFCLNI